MSNNMKDNNIENTKIIQTLKRKKSDTEEKLSILMKELLPQYEVDFSNLEQLSSDLENNIIVSFFNKIEIERLISTIQGLERGIKARQNLPPEENDILYQKEIYPLRKLYYEFYNNNPTIKQPKAKDYTVFIDNTLPITANMVYTITGPFSFTFIMIGTGEITIKFTREAKEKLTEVDIMFIKELFAIYNSKIELILQHNMYFISCIKKEMFSWTQSKDFAYTEFFARLCDNNLWNIYYIDPSLKEEICEESSKMVNTEYIDFGHKCIAKDMQISVEELIQKNSAFASLFIASQNSEDNQLKLKK